MMALKSSIILLAPAKRLHSRIEAGTGEVCAALV